MASGSSTLRPTCRGCGFTAPSDSDEWEVASHPSLGSLTRCPDCGSTNVESRGSPPA